MVSAMLRYEIHFTFIDFLKKEKVVLVIPNHDLLGNDIAWQFESTTCEHSKKLCLDTWYLLLPLDGASVQHIMCNVSTVCHFQMCCILL